MSDRTYTVVGTSFQNGRKTLRLANGTAAAREKILVKAGCEDIRLFDLPSPMTAEQAEAWLVQQGDSVPARASKPAGGPAVSRASARPIPARREYAGTCQHEELGFAASGRSREFWDSKSLIARQELSRNAAIKSGIKIKKGDYPELEDWLELQSVFTRLDGSVYENETE